MKKYIGFMVLAGLVLSFSVALAEDTNSSDNDYREKKQELKNTLDVKRDAFKSEMEAKRAAFKLEIKSFSEGLKADREAFKAEVKAKKLEFKKEKTEKKVEFCGKAQEMVTKRFGGAIKELEAHQVKLSDVIIKLNAEGKDTTLATESLNLSKSKLAEAKAKLLALKALLPVNCANMTPETFEKIKLGAREAKDLLKESRENLHQVIKEIRVLRAEDKEENEN